MRVPKIVLQIVDFAEIAFVTLPTTKMRQCVQSIAVDVETSIVNPNSARISRLVQMIAVLAEIIKSTLVKASLTVLEMSEDVEMECVTLTEEKPLRTVPVIVCVGMAFVTQTMAKTLLVVPMIVERVQMGPVIPQKTLSLAPKIVDDVAIIFAMLI